MAVETTLEERPLVANNPSDFYAKVERCRQLGIYADVVSETEVLSFSSLDTEFAFELMEDARFAVGLLRMAIENEFSFEALTSIWPVHFGSLEVRAQEMRSRIEAMVAIPGGEH